MSITVKNNNNTLLLIGGGVLAYFWWKGSQTVPSAPAGSDTPTMANTLIKQVKQGAADTLALIAPGSTTITPVVTTPVISTAAPVVATQSCLSGVGALKSTSVRDDAGNTAVALNTNANILPVSPRQIAAAAVTAVPVSGAKICQ